MNCEQFQQNLFGFQEGSLAKDLFQPMEAHLSSCTDCQRISEGFRQMTRLIDSEKAMEPNPFISTRILQRLESEFSVSASHSKQMWVRILQPVMIAVALVAGILIGSYSARTGASQAGGQVGNTDHIESLRSDFYISEITDEEKILVLKNQ